MIESKLTFFEMEIKVFAPNAAPLGQARFGRTPEAFNAIDVHAAAADEHAVAVLDAEMFPIAEVHQPVIADPAIRVNDAGQGDAPANNGPQSGPFCVGHDLRIHPALAFKDAEHDGLAAGATPAFTADPAAAEIGFVDFHGAVDWGMEFAFLRHAKAEGVKESIDRSATDVRELRHFGGFEVERKEADDLPKFGLGNM